ncbi:IS1/IS1595 family N-terminal zinc-binding domain-containing protein [Deinococcus peraridilitoris]|uniref:IS1/IS1595 family N-terminal zinc-binding domain-containing protein n=1 Tax=Deinococcus peraridilitoris TaxID=432329 RepID=UPI003CCB9C47
MHCLSSYAFKRSCFQRMTGVEWSMNTTRCARCQSICVVKNRHVTSGKQRFRCRACGWQFTCGPPGQLRSHLSVSSLKES